MPDEYTEAVAHAAELFAVPFATAVVKLKRALDAGEGVTLDPAEVKVAIAVLKMTRRHP